MKKRRANNIFGLKLIAVLATVAAVSCTQNFEQYNHNPNETTSRELERDNYSVGAKLLQLQNYVIPTEEHLFQFTEILAGDAYGGYAESTVDSWATKFSTFNPSSDWLKAPFVDVITNVYPAYRGIRNVTDDEVSLALSDVLRVAIMHRVTDQYGPIPYSKIIEDKKEQLTVPYDSQQEVYTQMFGELDAAIAVLNANVGLAAESFKEYDYVYGGNIAQWARFANSLKLRMAMRLTYVDEATARTKAAEAIAAGIIEQNADNAKFQPILNRCAMIWNDWKDHAASADLESYLNGYADPRRDKMFTKVGGELKGLRIGCTPNNKDWAIKRYSSPVVSDVDAFLWLNAAEAAFLEAEYELRWGTAAAAGANYRRGVELSFEERGASGVEAYLATAAQPASYIDSSINYSGFTPKSHITPVWSDAANFESSLERIITQKWIAIFPLGNEAWAEYRRTGYPQLAPVPAEYNKSGGTVNSAYGARRLQYPVEEYAENRTNVEQAVAEMLGGADNCGTRVWWDKKTSK